MMANRVHKGKAARKRTAPPDGDGPGRPTMFPGKRRDKHSTPYLTNDGWAAADKLAKYHQRRMGARKPPSFGDVVEDALLARAEQVGIT
jgi:hypothetical protein